MSNCLPQPNEPSSNYLYYIDMRLVKPFAEQQYLRGRVCHHPEDEPIGFGLLTTKPLHHVSMMRFHFCLTFFVHILLNIKLRHLFLM